MQEADHKTTYDRTITAPSAQYALANACKRTQHEIQQIDDHTIPRGRENKDHMRGRGEKLGRHKRSPIGTLKERTIKLRSLEHDTPYLTLHTFYTFSNLLLRPLRRMHPANGETSTTTTKTETPHAAMSWTACFDDGCLVHLSDKQGAYFPQKTTRRQPNQKGKKLR